MDKQQLPYSVDAERAVLSSILIDPDAYYQVATILEPAHFYLVKHQWIYSAVDSLAKHGKAYDLLTINEVLKSKSYGKNGTSQLDELGEPYMIGLMGQMAMSINVESYAEIVRAHAVRRHYIRESGKVASLAYDLAVPVDKLDAEAQSRMLSSPNRSNGRSNDINSIMDRYESELELMHASGKEFAGIPLGIRKLDLALGGVRNSRLYLICGDTGMGKTTLALNLVGHIAGTHRKSVAVFNIEQSNGEFNSKLVSLESGISPQAIEANRLTDSQKRVHAEAIRRIRSYNLHLRDNCNTASQILAELTKINMIHGVDLFIVDHIHRMVSDGTDMQQVNNELRVISTTLKNACKLLNVPGIMFGQVLKNIGQRQDKRPKLDDIRGSKYPAEESDAVLFLYRDEYYHPQDSLKPNITEFIVSKNRWGPRGFSVDVGFHAETGRMLYKSPNAGEIIL